MIRSSARARHVQGYDEIAHVLRDALEADKPSKEVANRRLLAAAERGDATAAALAIRSRASPETRDEGGAPHSCSRSRRTGSRSRGCWSIWVQTLMRWMTNTTRRGWSPV